MRSLFARDDTCIVSSDGDLDGLFTVRIISVFDILIASTFGAFFPLFSSRYSIIRMPKWCFLIAKYFGSGVIVATGFIHLLQPAYDQLNDPCLGGVWQQYPWAFGICLMSMFAIFFTELMANSYVSETAAHLAKKHGCVPEVCFDECDDYTPSCDYVLDEEACCGTSDRPIAQETCIIGKDKIDTNTKKSTVAYETTALMNSDEETVFDESYYGQILSLFVLEFGILFHSVFVGLSLAVTDNAGFISLFIVLIFHQMFEGLGLGARIAEAKWPENRKWTPWVLSGSYSLITPISIGAGLALKSSFNANSRGTLLVNGICDSISAGVLIYTGLVELMAHEFLYNEEFKGAQGRKKMLTCFGVMCFGTGIMALLGKWA